MSTTQSAKATFPDQTTISGKIKAKNQQLDQVLFAYKEGRESPQELWIPTSFISKARQKPGQETRKFPRVSHGKIMSYWDALRYLSGPATS